MVNVPWSLVHPGACPVSVNVPEPEPMPIAILPFMYKLLAPVSLDAVHQIVIVKVLPFIIPCWIRPFITVPVRKHWASASMLVKSKSLPVRVASFCVTVKVNEPSCCPVELDSVSDHAPSVVFVLEELPPQATIMTARTIAASAPTTFMKTPKRSGCTLGQRVLHSVLSARLLEELVGTLKTRRHIRQSMEVNRRKSALTLSTTGITTR